MFGPHQHHHPHQLAALAVTCLLLAASTQATHQNASSSASSPSSNAIQKRPQQQKWTLASAPMKRLAGSGGKQQVPEIRVLEDVFNPEQFKQVETFFYKTDSLTDGRHSLAEVQHMALTAKAHIVLDDMLMHRYDDYEELRASGGPEANQEICLRQLGELNERAGQQRRLKMEGRDINFHQLLDTYGRTPAGLLLLNTFWPGLADECQRLRIETSSGASTGTRYCIAHFRYSRWPETGVVGSLFMMKSGVCLPKACDSLNYKNKYKLVERLMEFNGRDIDQGQLNVTSLYCLPDRQSPTRSWWKSRETMAFGAALVVWLSVLAFATHKHRQLEAANRKKPDHQNQEQSQEAKFYKMLSVGHNLKQLFTINKPPPVQVEGVGELKKLIVDFRIIEGVKVVCMCYIVLGHVLMCFSKMATNAREFTGFGTMSLAYILTNLMPAFAVNAFFCITGLLTTYMVFKKNQSQPFMTEPVKWVLLIFYRYLRIMPMYMIVVAYLKYVSRFTGHGPGWDYGTSALSPRRVCEDEPWLVTLGFGANLKSPLEHCVPSAWYLANDFQFFCVTPIFMMALHWRPQFGRKLLQYCVALGCLAGVVVIMLCEVPDFKPILEFMPHGFLTHVIFLSVPYTGPIFRIPAYLCGLLIGYELYQYEQRTIDYLKARKAKEVAAEITQQQSDEATTAAEAEPISETQKEVEEPRWPEALIRHGPTGSLVCFIFLTALPLFCPYLPLNKFLTRLAVALFWPLFHVMFSLAVGLYILLASTGHGNQLTNRIFSANPWKPLARLSLCVVLTNIAVIDWFRQTRPYQAHVDLTIHNACNLYCIFWVYVVATTAYVLFEAPISNIINHFWSQLLASKSKRKSD